MKEEIESSGKKGIDRGEGKGPKKGLVGVEQAANAKKGGEGRLPQPKGGTKAIEKGAAR